MPKPHLFKCSPKGCLLAGLLLLTGCTTTVPIPNPPGTVDPATAWQTVLEKHVTETGTIDFAALRQDPSHLETEVHRVGTAEPLETKSREEQLVFVLNGYNALAMYLAITSEVQPEQKVRFFLLHKVPFAQQHVSLWHLENRIIRPMDEPRIHFALNCMVKDCPRLPQTAFTVAELETQLEDATKEFINSPKHVRYDAEAKTVHLSRILKWYRKDFGPEEEDLLKYLNRYRKDPIPEEAHIEWLPYDWSLNQTVR